MNTSSPPSPLRHTVTYCLAFWQMNISGIDDRSVIGSSRCQMDFSMEASSILSMISTRCSVPKWSATILAYSVSLNVASS